MSGLPAFSAFSATRRKVSAALDVLEQHQQRVGLALVEDEVGEVEHLQAGLVAGRHDVAEGQLLGAAVVEEGKADAAALGDDGELAARAPRRQQRARARLHGRAEGGAEIGRRVGEALASWGP